jgi:uncharacterized protein (TIGR03066 family)
MQAIRILALGCLALGFASSPARADAREDAQKALVGKWRGTETQGGEEITIKAEFTADGTLKLRVALPNEKYSQSGTYKVLGDSELELTIKRSSEKFKFKVEKDNLELSGPLPLLKGKSVMGFKLTRAIQK